MTNRYGIPKWLFTADPENTDDGSRIKVDAQNTGFSRGREFRSFTEITTNSTTPFYMKFICPVDFILLSQELFIDSGAMRLEVFVGSTPSGTWTVSPNTIGKNRMAERTKPYYVQQASIEVGGTFSGGTLVDLHVLRASSQSVTTSTTGGQLDHERGLPANTFYLKFSQLAGANGTSSGVYYNEWEERA